MTRSRYGFLVGIAGAAFAAWWLRRRQMSGAGAARADHGEVIYSNTPVAP